jgi:DNA-binding NarL/FixJ family response regulator
MTTTRAKVLIVDDHPLVREGLAARIADQPDMGRSRCSMQPSRRSSSSI